MRKVLLQFGICVIPLTEDYYLGFYTDSMGHLYEVDYFFEGKEVKAFWDTAKIKYWRWGE